MTWAELEKAFHRAWTHSFSKLKFVLTVPVLLLCGMLIVFCRTLALQSGEWMALTLGFLPILLSSSILLALGVLLVKAHVHEVKRFSFNFGQLVKQSLDSMVETSYLSLPSIFLYFILWIFLGIFCLLKQLTLVGDFFAIVLSFAPFLLILGSLILCIFNVLLLFFITPAAVLNPVKKIYLVKKTILLLRAHFFTSCILFFVALIPIALFFTFLSAAAFLTSEGFLVAKQSLSMGIEWFFMSLPFCIFLTPAVVFFFNFSAESYHILRSKSLQK